MGILKHIFSSKDVDPQVKYWVYLAGPLNCLIWGCKSWNVKKKQRKTQKLSSFSHKMNYRNHLDQSKRRKNHKWRIRYCFFQIPDLDAFIVQHMVRYIGKLCRSKDKTIPKKLLGAWIQRPRKTGKPQYSCNNNFLNAIHTCLPELTKDDQGLFKKWTQLTIDEEAWNSWIEDFFVSCQSENYDKMEQDEITQHTIMCMQNLRFDTESVK